MLSAVFLIIELDILTSGNGDRQNPDAVAGYGLANGEGVRQQLIALAVVRHAVGDTLDLDRAGTVKQVNNLVICGFRGLHALCIEHHKGHIVLIIGPRAIDPVELIGPLGGGTAGVMRSVLVGICLDIIISGHGDGADPDALIVHPDLAHGKRTGLQRIESVGVGAVQALDLHDSLIVKQAGDVLRFGRFGLHAPGVEDHGGTAGIACVGPYIVDQGERKGLFRMGILQCMALICLVISSYIGAIFDGDGRDPDTVPILNRLADVITVLEQLIKVHIPVDSIGSGSGTLYLNNRCWAVKRRLDLILCGKIGSDNGVDDLTVELQLGQFPAEQFVLVFTSRQIRGSLIPAVKGLAFLQLGAPQVLIKILSGEGSALDDSITDVIVYGILVVNHALDVVPVGGIDNIHLTEFIALDIAVFIPLSVPLKTAGGLVLCGIKLVKICVCGNFAHGGTQLVQAQVDPLNGFAGVPIFVDLEPYAALKGFRCGGIDIGKGGRSRNNSLGVGIRRPGTAVRYKSFLGGHSLRNSQAQGGSAVGGWLAFTIDFGHIDDLIALVGAIPGAAANGIGHLELPDPNSLCWFLPAARSEGVSYQPLKVWPSSSLGLHRSLSKSFLVKVPLSTTASPM